MIGTTLSTVHSGGGEGQQVRCQSQKIPQGRSHVLRDVLVKTIDQASSGGQSELHER